MVRGVIGLLVIQLVETVNSIVRQVYSLEIITQRVWLINKTREIVLIIPGVHLTNRVDSTRRNLVKKAKHAIVSLIASIQIIIDVMVCVNFTTTS